MWISNLKGYEKEDNYMNGYVIVTFTILGSMIPFSIWLGWKNR